MPWFELKTLKTSPDGGLVSMASDSKMFEAADVEQAKREGYGRTRDLSRGCVALLLDRNGVQVATYRAGEEAPRAVP